MLRQSLSCLPVILMLALGGCTAPEEPEAASAQVTTPAQGTRPAPPPQDRKPAPGGDCDLLSAEEIEQAFGGALSVRKVSGHGERGSGCTVSLHEGEEGQLSYQIGNRPAYEMRKDAYAAQPQLSFEPVSIGVEAYLVNNAQIIAIDAGDRSINMGLTLIVFNAEMPIDQAGTAAGLQSLATTALRRAGGG